MYTLDTNAIIYYLKHDLEATRVLKGILGNDSAVYISTITEVELFSFHGLTPTETDLIEEIIRAVSVIALDSSIARIAGGLRRLYNLKLPDAAIAATAMFTGSTLLTRNIRDFKKVPGLLLKQI